ncbi:hypothetical protein BESB_053220 [Besnoitia besnoiti]|uniref:Uncharacterized protein n=1 Tax=Besnoitia besnoiti TaxID=94643 RepID=A0A2A9MHC5_BESBE|nr:hypothetical protein BESB_053220 [Besnoitia besnoiti]PFH35671.1 hypothetical protein BESB_053220 [Besnoitia besnoiti]
MRRSGSATSACELPVPAYALFDQQPPQTWKAPLLPRLPPLDNGRRSDRDTHAMQQQDSQSRRAPPAQASKPSGTSERRDSPRAESDEQAVSRSHPRADSSAASGVLCQVEGGDSARGSSHRNDGERPRDSRPQGQSKSPSANPAGSAASQKPRDARSRRRAATAAIAAIDRFFREGEEGSHKRLRGPDGRFIRWSPAGRPAGASAPGPEAPARNKTSQNRRARPEGQSSSKGHRDATDQRRHAPRAATDTPRRAPAKSHADGGAQPRPVLPSSSAAAASPCTTRETSGASEMEERDDSSPGFSCAVNAPRETPGNMPRTPAPPNPQGWSSPREHAPAAAREVAGASAPRRDARGPDAARVVDAVNQAVSAIRELGTWQGEAPALRPSPGGFWGCLCIGWGTPPPGMTPSYLPQPSQTQAGMLWSTGHAPPPAPPVAPAAPADAAVAGPAFWRSSLGSGGPDLTPTATAPVPPHAGENEKAAGTGSPGGVSPAARRASGEPPCSGPSRPQEDTVRELEQWLRLLRSPLLPVFER